jgi:biofilm PGA synthesis N-glycosyltransferase PgaC
MPVFVETVTFIVFGVAVILLCHVYIMYPLSLLVLKKLYAKSEPVQRDIPLPPVAMVVAAYNEEQVIEEKIINFRALDYPPDKIRLYVGSDGSNDDTDKILSGYEGDERIRVRRFQRLGKASVLNALLSEVQEDIVLFSDANTMYRKDAVHKMVRRFSDPSVGGVCGNLKLTAPSMNTGMVGEEKYWFIETWLKKTESAIDSLIGATGGIYAIRRPLYEMQPVNFRIADDLLLPIRIRAKGYKIIFEEEAYAFEETSKNVFLEFRRRIGNSVGSIAVLRFWPELAPRLGLFFRYSFLSHKVLRWIIPFVLIALFISSGILAYSRFAFQVVFGLQILFGLAALLGLIFEKKKIKTGLFILPAYFLISNVAVLLGWFKLSASVGKQATWSTARSKTGSGPEGSDR